MSGKRRATAAGARTAILVTMLTVGLGAFTLPEAAAQPVVHDTRYYRLITDLDTERARAAAIRMTKMAEEYFRRTRDIARAQPRRKFDFYLYADPEDYYNSGGPEGSAGVYMRRGDPNAVDPRLGEAKLMAFVREGYEASAWHTIQHEGFHQFADVCIGDLPPWVNEGLAEYFGESMFTGDGYVSGLVNAERLERIRRTLDADQFLPMGRMMDMTLDAWNADLRLENYDQAWAMVHFLAHADNGRHQRPLAQFIQRVGRGEEQVSAWRNTFGGLDGMDVAFAAFWRDYDPDAAESLRAEVTLRTLTSYLGRGTVRGESYADFAALAADLRTGTAWEDVEQVGENWLPPDLRARTLKELAVWQDKGYRFELLPGRRPQLRMTPPEGPSRLAGFDVRGGLVQAVEVR